MPLSKSSKDVKATNSNKITKSKVVEIEEVDTFEAEAFFNKASHYTFIIKNNIGLLGDDMYESNDLHQTYIVTPADNRIMTEIMTTFEYTRILSERAKQIENGSRIFCDIEDETDILKIAEMEILQKKCPLHIIRGVTKHIIEIWLVNEMIIPFK